MTLTIDEKFALLQDMKVIDNNRRIVERLKKRIEEIKNLPHDVKTDDLWSWEAITDELQKIIEGEK